MVHIFSYFFEFIKRIFFQKHLLKRHSPNYQILQFHLLKFLNLLYLVVKNDDDMKIIRSYKIFKQRKQINELYFYFSPSYCKGVNMHFIVNMSFAI